MNVFTLCLYYKITNQEKCKTFHAYTHPHHLSGLEKDKLAFKSWSWF